LKGLSIFLVVLLGGSPASLAAENPPPLTADTVVESIEGHYRVLVDLTATVVQKNVLKSLGRTQKFDGTLSIKKPGRLRLDYTNGQIILVDGKAALFYSKKSEQVVKKTFTDIEHMNIPVAFLLGAGAIRNDFDVAQPLAATPRLIELLPKKPGAAMKKLRLLSDESGRITEMNIIDKSGNTTEILFSNIREGVGVDDKLFTFNVPKGTEVIEQ